MAVTGDAALISFVHRHMGRVVVITGAGCSTESGIPDYRSPNGLYKRPGFKPLTAQTFFRSQAEQQRYWGRSMMGYSSLVGKSCNLAHMALNSLCAEGVVDHVVTQNVDGLHHLAANGGIFDTLRPDALTTSSAPLTELHGSIHLVSCSSCGKIVRRGDYQRRLVAANAALLAELQHERAAAEAQGGAGGMMRPDGDYAMGPEHAQRVALVGCESCGQGPMRPHVVMFGENVPSACVALVSAKVTQASCVVCAGTSLQVYSAYRFVKLAKDHGVPVAIVNMGATRGDALADIKVECSSVATMLANLHDALLPASLLPRSFNSLSIAALE
jgi:NAD-dependent deacetylase sirtuin 4